MIPENKTMVLGTREFAVPPLPIGVNLIAYPLCRELVNSDMIKRCAEEGNGMGLSPAFTLEEMQKLADLAFLAAGAAEPGLMRADFDALPVKPSQLIDAFFVVRDRTGGWVPASEGDALGEAMGA